MRFAPSPAIMLVLLLTAAAGADQAMVVTFNPGRSTLPQPDALWLTGGERWVGRVTRADSRTVVMAHPTLGELQVRRDAVAAVDFRSELARPDDGEGVLIRVRGEPLPGDLLWLDDKGIGIDSVLGAIDLPRDQIVRFVLRPLATIAVATDVVRLLDGTVLHGRAKLDGDTVTLAHEHLGELRLPRAALRSVTFASRGWFLTREAPASVTAAPLVAAHADADAAMRVAIDDATGQARLQLRPGVTAVFARPTGAAGRLHAIVQPAPGTRGTVRLTVRAGAAVLVDRQVKPGDAPVPIAADVSAEAKQIAIQTEFVQTLQLPAGVWLVEPHVVPAATQEP